MSKPLIVAKTTEITHDAWLAARRKGLTVKECPNILQSKEHPFMIANVDGIVVEKVGTKTVCPLSGSAKFSITLR